MLCNQVVHRLKRILLRIAAAKETQDANGEESSVETMIGIFAEDCMKEVDDGTWQSS